jgi:DNA polymerase-4
MGLVVHADLDTYFVSVQRLLDPSLMGKPVVVGGDPHGRGIVAACSYETRAYGVHAGMSARDAYRLCPQALFVHGHGEYYGYYSRVVQNILERFTPDAQPMSIDEFSLDFTGMERIYPQPDALARRIREKVYLHTGLPISLGAASNRLVAKVAASEAKPDGYLIVPPGEEAAFLAPLPLSRMPGIGPVTERLLSERGLRTLGDVAKVPLVMLRALLGMHGEALRKKCLGEVIMTAREKHVTKSIGHESTFKDTADPGKLRAILAELVEEAGFRLREGGFTARLIILKLRYSDFETMTHQRQVDPLFADEDIYRLTCELFAEAFRRRVSVRLVGIRLAGLVRDLSQIPLFEWERRLQQQQLCAALDGIRSRYGQRAVSSLTALSAMSAHGDAPQAVAREAGDAA